MKVKYLFFLQVVSVAFYSLSFGVSGRSFYGVEVKGKIMSLRLDSHGYGSYTDVVLTEQLVVLDRGQTFLTEPAGSTIKVYFPPNVVAKFPVGTEVHLSTSMQIMPTMNLYTYLGDISKRCPGLFGWRAPGF